MTIASKTPKISNKYFTYSLRPLDRNSFISTLLRNKHAITIRQILPILPVDIYLTTDDNEAVVVVILIGLKKGAEVGDLKRRRVTDSAEGLGGGVEAEEGRDCGVGEGSAKNCSVVGESEFVEELCEVSLVRGHNGVSE